MLLTHGGPPSFGVRGLRVHLYNDRVARSERGQLSLRMTSGAAWLQPTSIAAPQLARIHVTFHF